MTIKKQDNKKQEMSKQDRVKDAISDLENVLFDMTEGRVYDAMRDLENVINELVQINKQSQQIQIPITECDINMFQDLVYKGSNNFVWTFDNVDVEFINNEEGLL